MDKLDAEFAERVRALAQNTGRGLDWAKPKPEEMTNETKLDEFIQGHPKNYTALMEQAKKAVGEKDWVGAKAPLQKLIELYPNQHEPDGAYAMLAHVHRELGETAEEWKILNQLAELTSDATDAFARLMEIAVQRQDWSAVLVNVARYQAVNPLNPISYRNEGQACEALGKKPQAIAGYQTLLRLNPVDASDVHYRLARLLFEAGDATAKKHVLLALEDAPRFRAAYDLLMQMNDAKHRDPAPPPSPPPPSKP